MINSLLMTFCDTLFHLSMKCGFKLLVLQTADLYMHSSINPKFGGKLGSGITSFQFIQTSDQDFDHFHEHHYLQTVSDVNIASFSLLQFKTK